MMPKLLCTFKTGHSSKCYQQSICSLIDFEQLKIGVILHSLVWTVGSHISLFVIVYHTYHSTSTKRQVCNVKLYNFVIDGLLKVP